MGVASQLLSLHVLLLLLLATLQVFSSLDELPVFIEGCFILIDLSAHLSFCLLQFHLVAPVRDPGQQTCLWCTKQRHLAAARMKVGNAFYSRVRGCN